MTIRIGLLGASKISRGAVPEPASSISGVEMTRVAARDPGCAGEFAQTHGIPAIAADYRALVSSDAVDLVYNALPPAGLDAELSVTGERGSVRMVNPLLPHVGHNIVVNVDGWTTYWHQFEHVIALLSGNTPEVLDGADAIANMQIIDDIRRRAEIPVPV